MAKYIWSGQSFNVTIGNKQKDNTGISNIKLSYYTDLTLAAESVSVTNSTAGNTTASVGTFTPTLNSDSRYTYFSTLTGVTEVNGTKISPTANTVVAVNWKGSGTSDNHAVKELFIARPITGVTITPNKTTVWSDETLTANVAVQGTNVFKRNGAVTISLSNDGVFGVPSSVAVGTNTFTHVDSATINGSTTFTMQVATKAGAPNVAGAMAATYFTATSSQITVKNAVSSIKLNDSLTDSTIYLTYSSGSTSVSYVVSGTCPGSPYSSAVSISKAPDTTYASATIGNGEIVVSSANVGTTTVQLKSDAAATAKYSPVLTIIVMPASTSIYLNTGDTWQTTVPTGSTVDTTHTKYKTAVATGAISGSTLTITAGATAGDSEVKVTAGGASTIYTVHVEHITVTVS